MTPERPNAVQSGPLRLDHLTALDARRIVRLNPRLLVPVGTMIPRGPELPLGCDSIILDRLADDLSARLQMPRAPVIPFGVQTVRDPEAPGSAGLTRKTLHRLMNELIAGWETEAKVEAFFILTTHAADAHLEALSTIRAEGRITLIDIYATPLPDDGGSGSVDAALLEVVAPECIDRTLAPASAEQAERGRILYAALVDHIARRVSQPAG